MARYLLDSDTCIYIAKHRPAEVRARFARLKPGDAVMSVITFGELCYGASKSAQSEAAMSRLQQFAELVPPLEVDAHTAEVYGELRAALKRSPIGGNDLWIAAQAVARRLTLVTNNVREFSRIQPLKHENWVDR